MLHTCMSCFTLLLAACASICGELRAMPDMGGLVFISEHALALMMRRYFNIQGSRAQHLNT